MAGRPALYESADAIWEAAEQYFLRCAEQKRRPTITKLAYELGFESRQSLYDYGEREQFSYIIKRLRLFVESEYEEALQDGNCTGAIFALKNMGWKDKTEREITTPQGITVNYNTQPGNVPLNDD